VKGTNIGFSTNLLTGIHSTRLFMKDVDQLQFRYLGTSLLGVIGYARIPNGFFEAEPFLNSKASALKEQVSLVLLILWFIASLSISAIPIAYSMGYIDLPVLL